MSGKRKCHFNDDLKRKYNCFEHVINSTFEALCTVCNVKVSIANKGKYDLEQHMESKKHRSFIQAGSTTKNINDFFVSKNSKLDKNVAAAEGTLAFHILKHNMSFRSSDCTTQLLKSIFSDSQTAQKISSGKTKTAAIAKNAIVPFCIKKVMESVQNTPFISISVDASNHGAQKLLPLVIQYFKFHKDSDDNGINTKLINLETTKSETAEVISDYIVKTLQEFDLANKCIAFSGDNCNTNFGGINRQGKNNVFTLLKDKLGKDLLGVGCPLHIIHNAAKHGLDTLAFDVEVIAIKIYNFFCIYTVRTENLKEFCDFMQIEFRNLLYHSSTRWLSLYPVINRILQMFPALKSYFLSQENCPNILKTFFESDFGEVTLWFAHSIMYVFHEKTKQLEAEKNSLLETKNVIMYLDNLLQNRLDECFMPLKVKELLQKLENEGLISDVAKFKTELVSCYKKMGNYIKLWTKQFNEFFVFDWMEINVVPDWPSVEKSIIFINAFAPNFKINDTKCFDQYINLKNFVQSNLKDEKFLNLTTNEKWVKYFEVKSNNEEFYSELLKISQFFFCIPSHNANIERVFSMITNQWTKQRNRLSPTTIKSIMTVTYNFKDTKCRDFYELIKKDGSILTKISDSSKYNFNNDDDDNENNENGGETFNME